jgi:hypothetical protein
LLIFTGFGVSYCVSRLSLYNDSRLYTFHFTLSVTEHNFGHGEKHLSSTLLSLNVLAFLSHTILQLIDARYQEIRRKRGTRRSFFQDILSRTQVLCL